MFSKTDSKVTNYKTMRRFWYIMQDSTFHGNITSSWSKRSNKMKKGILSVAKELSADNNQTVNT